MSKGDVKAERKSSNSGIQSQRSSGGGGGGGAGRSIQLKRDASRAGEFQAQEALLAPVQRKGQGSASGDVHSAAAHGTSGSAAALPHAAQIQRAFGDHDISHIKAHTDQKAAEGSAAMGAQAYASGDRVAFKGAPSLHTAAHEAAHIVQQKGGVQLSGGVGQAGDSYEKQADAVADAVVAGKDASGLLGKPKGGGSRAVQRAIQRKDEKPAGGIKREGVDFSNLIKGGVKREDLDAKYTTLRPTKSSRQATLAAIAAEYQNRLPDGWEPPLHDLDKAPASAPPGNLRMAGPGGAPLEPGAAKPEKPNIADHLSSTEHPMPVGQAPWRHDPPSNATGSPGETSYTNSGNQNDKTKRSTKVAGAITSEGAKVVGERELIPAEAEIKIPIYGVQDNGIWCSIKPSIKLGAEAGFNWKGGGKGKASAKISCEVGIKAGFKFGTEPFLGSMSVGGSTSLAFELNGLEISTDADGNVTFGAFNCGLVGQVHVTGDAKAVAGTWDYKKELKWSSAKLELLKFSTGGYTSKNGFSGPKWEWGAALKPLVDFFVGDNGEKRQADAASIAWAKRDLARTYGSPSSKI
jgi:hypothetical protein